jgi:UPF0755 protein
MNKKKIFIILAVILGIIVALVLGFFISIAPVSKSNESVIFTINPKESKKVIVENLKSANLIKSKYATLGLIVLTGKFNIQAGTYELARNMSASEIITSLANGDVISVEKPSARITFKEGITLKEYMQLLSDNTNLEYETIINELNDTDLIKTLINDYWFLTDDILNSDLYYNLEGYLFPTTYDFYLDTTLEQALRIMLNQTDKVLTQYKESLSESKYSIHEILTMASIIEKEGKSYLGRTKVSQVIYKRLELNMSLGMDVTSYYGVQKSFSETLTSANLTDDNPYNTRKAGFVGLPVGPICNPSEEAIKAALNPSDTNYIYFFAEKNGTVHFTDDYNEFNEFKKIYKW